MPAAFQPLSAIAPAELIEYLGREGNSPEIVKWKYFHSGFNRGRERGYVWVRDGKVGGFIGLIPFRLSIGGRTVEAAWTCDWSVQDQTGRGTGILLIRQAQDSYEFLTQLGGNEATQRIVSRLAAFTSNESGVMFYLPLRLGAILRLARRALPRIPFDAVAILNRLPVRWPRRAASDSIIVEPGVSKVLTSVLNSEDHGDMYSRYDLEYVQWQIGDCPVLLSETCYLGGRATPSAAALLWREKQAPEFWRMNLWVAQGAQKEADALLSGVIRHVHDSGGFLLTMLVSRLDIASINLLRAKHFFLSPRRRPLHIIDSKKTGKPVPEMWPLSFVDTDMAYRIYVNS
jgi:hypothetical protein